VLVNAGVVIDLVATLLEAKDKLTFVRQLLEDKQWSDAIYHALCWSVTEPALLLSEKQKAC
jgi:sulfite reductase (ferredoxin)